MEVGIGCPNLLRIVTESLLTCQGEHAVIHACSSVCPNGSACADLPGQLSPDGVV